MGRRSFGFSMTQINRMISASNAANRAREREELISSQRGISKEQKPKYSISKFDFNTESRVSHIEFLETTLYRRIEKYVTQNGERFPIYSNWLSKTKTIRKTIKLTNEVLENLNVNDDWLIQKFSHEIVAKIGNEDFYPSWFIIDTLINKEAEEIKEVENGWDLKNKNEFENITNIKKEIASIEIHKESELSSLEKEEKKLTKLNKALNKASSRRGYVLLSIITFGIHLVFHSNWRIRRIENKINEHSKMIFIINESISLDKNKIKEMNIKISKYKEKILHNNESKDNDVKDITKKYEEQIRLVVPLPTTIGEPQESDFIPLKKLAGMNYEKLVGCYIIRNIEKNKYYVGQSKDVLKRVCRQHFNGTKVKNIIFAEDYYSSQIDNKDDLFEVKIIKLETKDELDKKEQELIEEYDSFNSGYNGTNGNK